MQKKAGLTGAPWPPKQFNRVAFYRGARVLKMRMAMIGNINNASFLLAEGLRSIGVEVRLLLTRSENIHHPVRAGLIDSLPDWIHDASDLGYGAFENQEPAIGSALSFVTWKADLAILNEVGPSLHNLLTIPVLSFLTGSDLTYYASTSSGLARRQGWSPGFASSAHGITTIEAWERIVFRQRAGIRRSLLVIYPGRGAIPSSDDLLDEIGIEDEKRLWLLDVDINRIDPTMVPTGRVLKMFNGARLNWVEPMPPGFSDQDHKGTDTLLRGFAAFLNRGGEGELTLVAKGLHVNETRILAQQLGIERHIVWKQEMTQAEFYREMASAHLVCCNLGKSVPGQVGLSAMAAGRPTLANFHAFSSYIPGSWPVCDARTADEVAEHLWTLYREPDRRSALGAEARRFSEVNLSPASAARLLMQRLSDCMRLVQLESQVRDLAH